MEQAKEWVIPQGGSPAIVKEDRGRIVSLIRRFGGATTDAVLDPATQFFSVADINGVIGYRLAAGCIVVFGDPISAPFDKGPLAQAFHRYAESQGKSIIYICTSKDFAHWAIKNVCGALVEFGVEYILDPSDDPRKKTGTRASLVRRKERHAQKEGVKITEYLNRDLALEQAIEQVGEKWLKSRTGPQIHISNIYLFTDPIGKRWFYATQGDKTIGVLVLNQLQASQGWLLNHLMVVSDAPGGTPEYLVLTAMETLAQEGCHYVSVGMVTVDQLGEIIGLGKISKWVACEGFKFAKKIAHLDGLNTFWEKFHPRSEPSYLLFGRKQVGVKELLALKTALYGGNLG